MAVKLEECAGMAKKDSVTTLIEKILEGAQHNEELAETIEAKIFGPRIRDMGETEKTAPVESLVASLCQIERLVRNTYNILTSIENDL